MRGRVLILSAVFAGFAGAAAAHTGVGHVHGFAAGWQHPLGGLDHILAMVTVGLWAAFVGGRARIAYPLAFMGMMALAAVIGMSGVALPGVEAGIAMSVIALGLAVALRISPPLVLGAALCGGLAMFHGYAHGAELPAGSGWAGYAAGFLLATGALHAAGIGLGALIQTHAPKLARLAGAATALAGLAILAG